MTVEHMVSEKKNHQPRHLFRWLSLLLLLALVLCVPLLSQAQEEAVVFNGDNFDEYIDYARANSGTAVTYVNRDDIEQVEDIVPEGATKIILGNNPDGTQDFIVPQDNVTVLINGREGLSVTRVTSEDSPKTTPPVFTVTGLSTAQLNELKPGRKVFIMPGSGGYNAAAVRSLNGNTLTLEPSDGTATTIFSYVKYYRLSPSDSKSASGNNRMASVGKSKTKTFNANGDLNGYGSYEIEDGEITVSGHASGGIYPLYVSVGFDVEINLPNVLVELETPEIELICVKLIPMLEIEIVPEVLSVSFSPEFVVEGSVSGKFSFSFNIEEGFDFYYKVRVFESDICHKSRTSSGPTIKNKSTELVGEVFIGLAWGPQLEVLEGLASIGCEYKGGVVFQGSSYTGRFEPDDTETMLLWHACNEDGTLGNCMEIRGFPRMGPLAVVAKFAKAKHTIAKLTDPDDGKDFLEYYLSKTYNDSGHMLCPHKGHRLDVHVVGNNGLVLKDAVVSYTPHEDHFKEAAEDVEYDAKEGCWLLYVPSSNPSSQKPTAEGNTVTVTAELDLNGKHYEVSKQIRETGAGKIPNPPSLTLSLDVGRTLKFDANKDQIITALGKTEVIGIPDPINYIPSPNSYVHIPDHVPMILLNDNGYHFIGWNDRADGRGTTYSLGSRMPAVDEDVTLYAQWEPGETTTGFTVYYNANGGSFAPKPQRAKLSDANVKITDIIAIWDHHEFLGWSLDEDAFEADFHGLDLVSPETLNPKKETVVVLYAVWKFDPVDPPYKLTYNMNGGPEAQRPADQFAAKNSWLMICSDYMVWDDMHTFTGWSDDQYADVGSIGPGSTIQMTEDRTLYAIWKIKPAPYPNMITFEDSQNSAANGTAQGMPNPVYFSWHEGVEVNLPNTFPTKEGVVFAGWDTDPSGRTVRYVPGARIYPDGDMTLYAVWIPPINDYIILYNPNGGTYAPPLQHAKLGEVVLLSEEPAEWEHHEFLGWSLSPEASEAEYSAGQTFVNRDGGRQYVVLYAVWAFDPVHMPVRLTYNMNGGPESQKPADQWAKAGSYVQISSATPVWNDDYVFNGWSLRPKSLFGEYQPGEGYRLDEDTTLYAVWYYVPSGTGIEITYDLNGYGTGLPEKQKVLKNMLFELSKTTPVCDGQHTFLGWSTNRLDTRPMYKPGQKARFGRSTRLYAVWSTKYRITEGNGSTWRTNSSRGLRFVANGDYRYFHFLKIDGNVVDHKRYSLSSGSTVIVLPPEFLRKLKPGTHTISFVYYDGVADGIFTVQKKTPLTGDAGQPGLWIALVLLGLGTLAVTARRKAGRRKQGP